MCCFVVAAFHFLLNCFECCERFSFAVDWIFVTLTSTPKEVKVCHIDKCIFLIKCAHTGFCSSCLQNKVTLYSSSCSPLKTVALALVFRVTVC